MGRTQHLGLNKFGAEGRLSDEGYKFSLRDRELMDSILFTLGGHAHEQPDVSVFEGPTTGTAPLLTTADTGGTLFAGRDYYYKVSYVDVNGNETASSAAGLVNTPDPIVAPEAGVLVTADTGGTLLAGTYKYTLAFFQDSGGVTTAPNRATILVPTGSTNTVTVPLPTLPDGADGWKVYRKSPGDIEYWLLKTISSGPTEYVDDGSDSPDCSQKTPTANTTNSTNTVTITLTPSWLPLDNRVVGWRIYRTSSAGSYIANSLVTTVVETLTEGGADLVTTFTDIGDPMVQGIPLTQTAVPEAPPQLDASKIFDALSGALPSSIAPLGVGSLDVFLPGTLSAQDYHQFVPPHDLTVERIDAFYLTAPTGLTPSTDFLTLRFEDDATQDEVQSLFNDATTQNEIQQLFNDATSGTFTLGDGTDTTSAIQFDALSDDIETRLEADITAIVDVTVVGSGTPIDPWVITWIDPGSTNFVQLTVVDTLTGGSSTITTTVEGSDGGTFTLSDGTDTTSGIAAFAAGSVLKTRLEADITSITTVTVTGTGTESDPWVITFNNPGDQNLDVLIVSDASLNGISTIVETTRGFGITQVDLIIDQNQQGHFFQSQLAEGATQEAEDAPAAGGVQVSDTLALNDVAMELDDANEVNHWQVGLLSLGDYIFKFWVADVDLTSTFVMRVNELTVETQSLHNNSTTGDFTLRVALPPFFLGETTAAIPFNESAANLKTAMELLPSVNQVSVTGIGTSGDPWKIDFENPAGNVSQLTTTDAGMDGTSTIATDVAGTNTVLDSITLSPARPVYTPEYELFATLDGTEIIQMEVEKTDSSGPIVRVDKYEYEALLPVLKALSNVSAEILITGTPSTNGDDLQVTLWH